MDGTANGTSVCAAVRCWLCCCSLQCGVLLAATDRSGCWSATDCMQVPFANLQQRRAFCKHVCKACCMLSHLLRSLVSWAQKHALQNYRQLAGCHFCFDYAAGNSVLSEAPGVACCTVACVQTLALCASANEAPHAVALLACVPGCMHYEVCTAQDCIAVVANVVLMLFTRRSHGDEAP